MKRLYLKAFLSLSVLSMALVFQNCSTMEDFESLYVESGVFTGSSVSLSGAQLYANNCASCHNNLSNSTKRNRSYEQINNAIQSVPSMAGNSMLGEDKLRLIALALSDQNSVTKFSCQQPNTRGESNDSIRRLSQIELENTLRDLLTTNLFNDLASEINLFPFENISTEMTEIKSVQVDALISIADKLGFLIIDNDSVRASFINQNTQANCTSFANSDSDTCYMDFLELSGKKFIESP